MADFGRKNGILRVGRAFERNTETYFHKIDKRASRDEQIYLDCLQLVYFSSGIMSIEKINNEESLL